MKKQILSMVSVLSLTFVAGSALAQNRVEANVPFNFTVNRTNMPAGAYVITALGSSGNNLLIQSHDKNAAKLVMPNHAEISSPSKTTKLVFHCYGKDQCFLYQIWVEGMRRGPRDRIRALIAGCEHGKGTPQGVPFGSNCAFLFSPPLSCHPERSEGPMHLPMPPQLSNLD